MCGIVFACATRPVRGFLSAAHAWQKHRGPDGEGLAFMEVGGVFAGMAHQRLAIVGLSESGAQPMLSASGRFRIIFNGEIYNYRELAKQFGLRNLNSGTDTEVVVEMIERLGIYRACQLFNGMWALVVHDINLNLYYISRDRFGKKPLYFHRNATGIYFASEMHSLLGLPTVGLTVDVVTASRFLAQSLQNVDTRSWLENITSFPNASVATIDGAFPLDGLKNVQRYWAPNYENPIPELKLKDAIPELRALVQDAIQIRLHADVPVGVALSGGLDSSIISIEAARKVGQLTTKTKLFSAVNPGSSDDESPHVDVMARHLESDVHRFSLDLEGKEDLFELLKKCIRYADGPVSSFSSVLFYKLMENAQAADIKVVLTGQGADEAFCGYRKYPILEIKRLLRAGKLIEATQFAAGFLMNGTILPQFSFSEAKRYMGSSNRPVMGNVVSEALDLEPLGTITSLSERQWLDISRYSVPYLCHYEDRMSMAWSREVRSPFLDFRVVEMGLRLPERLKLSEGWTKFALRKAFERDLPSSIAWRKDKKGFVNPQDHWLKGSLKSVLRDYMSSQDARVYRAGLVDRNGFLRQFDEYCAGNRKVWFRDVFAPFALEVWLREAADIEAQMKNMQQCLD